MNEDVLTFTGDTVKSLGDGRVGGYLVRFTDANNKDLSGEYFTAKTYYGAAEGNGSDCLFHHSQAIKGVDEAFTDHIFAPLKTRRDSIGIFAETVLNMADDYEKKVAELVDAGKLGWSSGAAGHTCRKSADGEILRWIIAEGSLTPTPCDKNNHGGIRPLKSLELTGEAIKDVLASTTGYAPANNRSNTPLTPLTALHGAVEPPVEASAADGSTECPACHLHCHFDENHTECPYCGQRLLPTTDASPLAGKAFADELDTALAAVNSCYNRAESLHALRVKSDRTLSAVTRLKVRDLSDSMTRLALAIEPGTGRLSEQGSAETDTETELKAASLKAAASLSMTLLDAEMALWAAQAALGGATLTEARLGL